MDEKLLEALNTLIQQKTLSLEAFEIVQDLKTKYENVSKQLVNAMKDLKASQQLNTQFVEEVSKYKIRLEGIEFREYTVTEREKKMMKLEIEHECGKAMVNHTVDMFKTVFANAALKTSIMREVAVPSTYTSNGTSSTGIIKEKIQETTERQVD